MLVFVVSGEGAIHLKYAGAVLDSATKLDSAIINPPTEQIVYFKGGAETTLADNCRLVGETSACILQVKRVVVTAGSIAGDDAEGILFVEVLSGTVTSGENLQIDSTTQCVALTSNIQCKAYGLQAKAAYLSCEAQSVRYRWDGVDASDADDTAVSYGHLLTSGEEVMINGWINVKNLSMTNAADNADGTIYVTVAF